MRKNKAIGGVSYYDIRKSSSLKYFTSIIGSMGKEMFIYALYGKGDVYVYIYRGRFIRGPVVAIAPTGILVKKQKVYNFCSIFH